jgi:hypothetical protein
VGRLIIGESKGVQRVENIGRRRQGGRPADGQHAPLLYDRREPAAVPLPNGAGDLGHDDGRRARIGEQGGTLDAIEKRHRAGPCLRRAHRNRGERGALHQAGEPDAGFLAPSTARLGHFTGGREAPHGKGSANM